MLGAALAGSKALLCFLNRENLPGDQSQACGILREGSRVAGRHNTRRLNPLGNGRDFERDLLRALSSMLGKGRLDAEGEKVGINARSRPCCTSLFPVPRAKATSVPETAPSSSSAAKRCRDRSLDGRLAKPSNGCRFCRPLPEAGLPLACHFWAKARGGSIHYAVRRQAWKRGPPFTLFRHPVLLRSVRANLCRWTALLADLRPMGPINDAAGRFRVEFSDGFIN